MPLNSDPEITRKSKELVVAWAKGLCLPSQTTWTDVPALHYLGIRRGAPRRMVPANQEVLGGQGAQC